MLACIIEQVVVEKENVSPQSDRQTKSRSDFGARTIGLTVSANPHSFKEY